MLPGLARPGRTSSVGWCAGRYQAATKRGSSGRGPTSAISPRSTLNSCGSSSILDRRSKRPHGNTRGSWLPVMGLPASSATVIERNLNIENVLPCRPARGARKITGPGLLTRMPRATSSISGLSTMSAATAAAMSNSRLPIPHHPPPRHEHLGRLEAGLRTPVVRPVPQRLQRTGVGVVANLALVARHRLHLRVERVRDVDPRVGDERSRVSPFGAAGGVERANELDEVLCRPGRYEHGL